MTLVTHCRRSCDHGVTGERTWGNRRRSHRRAAAARRPALADRRPRPPGRRERRHHPLLPARGPAADGPAQGPRTSSTDPTTWCGSSASASCRTAASPSPPSGRCSRRPGNVEGIFGGGPETAVLRSTSSSRELGARSAELVAAAPRRRARARPRDVRPRRVRRRRPRRAPRGGRAAARRHPRRRHRRDRRHLRRAASSRSRSGVFEVFAGERGPRVGSRGARRVPGPQRRGTRPASCRS